MNNSSKLISNEIYILSIKIRNSLYQETEPQHYSTCSFLSDQRFPLSII